MANYKDKTALPIIKIAVWIALSLLIIGVAFYIALPPINPHAGEFWTFLFFCVVTVVVLDVIINGLSAVLGDLFSGKVTKSKLSVFPKRIKIPLIVVGVLIVLLIILNIFSTQFLRAGSYSSMIEINEVPFEEALAETEYVSDIALMDSTSAQISETEPLARFPIWCHSM